MAIQASGTISISDLRTEFGGSVPDSISEYYRGGGLVPDNATNAGIPTSGSISLSDFYSSAAVTNPEFNFGTYSASTTTTTPTDATASITFNTDGTITVTSGTNGNYENAGEVVESDYDIRLDYVSGSGLNSTLVAGTWYRLNFNRLFSLTKGGGSTGTVSGVFTARIRPTGGGSDIDTATVNLSASVNSGA